MASIQLVNQRTREVHLRNDLKKVGQLQLRSNFNFGVRFAANNQSCVATFYQSFEDKSEEQAFSASVTLEGVFACKDVVTAEDKKEIHVAAYDALFPYVQSALGQLFSNSGIPGFLLKKVPLDQNHVVIKDNQPKSPTLPIV